MVVWGTRLYGKVDEIAGAGHVATKFGHLFWIPLIPYESYFVTGEQRHDFTGVPLGLHTKSVVVAYLRAATLILFFLGFGAANALFNPTEQVDPGRIPQLQCMLVLGILSLPTYLATKMPWCEQASAESAADLAQRIEAANNDRSWPFEAP